MLTYTNYKPIIAFLPTQVCVQYIIGIDKDIC